MITVDTIGRVRRAHFVQKKSIKAISRELRLARNTVRSIIRAEAETERRYERRAQPMPQLGPYIAALEAMLAANARRPKRERLTCQRMLEELRLEGYRGSYDNVRRYARSWAERRARSAGVLPHTRGMRVGGVPRCGRCATLRRCAGKCAATAGMGKGR